MTERTYSIPRRARPAFLTVGGWPRDEKGRARKHLRGRPFLRTPSGAARVLCRTGFRCATAVPGVLKGGCMKRHIPGDWMWTQRESCIAVALVTIKSKAGRPGQAACHRKSGNREICYSLLWQGRPV